MKNCSKCRKKANTTIVPENGSISYLCDDCLEKLYEDQETAMLAAINLSIIADCATLQ